jgi:FdhD protein
VTETRSISIHRSRGGFIDETSVTDEVVVEEPLEIRIRASRIAVLMRTPGHDDDLVRGFLFTEHVVTDPADIARIESCSVAPSHDDALASPAGTTENVIDAILHPRVDLDLERLRRNVFASSSCGVCGKAALENVLQMDPPISPTNARFSVRDIGNLVERLRGEQHAFARTGGLHAAALFDAEHALLVAREDVGRHNAVDKAIGHALGAGTLSRARALVVSGRVSFEIVQKAAAARLSLIAAVSAPSSLAVETARALDLALVGFVRDNSCNVYVRTPVIVGDPLT